MTALNQMDASSQMLGEERIELVPWNQADAVVQVDVPCAGNVVKLFGLKRTLVGILTEFAGIRGSIFAALIM